jgi:hypothetical protein
VWHARDAVPAFVPLQSLLVPTPQIGASALLLLGVRPCAAGGGGY